MCKDLLFAITTATTSVAQNNTIPLSTIARRYSSRMTLIDNAIVISKAGYYKINADVVASSTAGGTISVVAQGNGSNVPALTSSATVDANGVATLPIDGVIRVFQSDTPYSLTLVNTGVAINEINVAVTVEYIG